MRTWCRYVISKSLVHSLKFNVCAVTHELRLQSLAVLPQTVTGSLYLSVWVRAVVAEHQVGSRAVEQQVHWLEGQGEALDSLTEVKGVPQVLLGGVDKKILKEKKRGTHNLAQKQDTRLLRNTFFFF